MDPLSNVQVLSKSFSFNNKRRANYFSKSHNGPIK